jgi:hypothetical protein
MTTYSKPCPVCPTLVLAHQAFGDGDFANAGRYLRDAVALFVDSLSVSRGIDPPNDVLLFDRIESLAVAVNIGPEVREDLINMVDVADAAIRGDDLSVTRAGHKVCLRQVLHCGISWLFEFAQSQSFCSHDCRPGVSPLLGWKAGAA